METLLPAVAVSIPDGTSGPAGRWIPVSTAAGIQQFSAPAIFNA